MAINATIVKQAKSGQGFQRQCLRVEEPSHFALEQNFICPPVKSITPPIFVSSLKFSSHPKDTRDSPYSLYIPDMNQVNWVLLKLNYLFMWSFKLTGVEIMFVPRQH